MKNKQFQKKPNPLLRRYKFEKKHQRDEVKTYIQVLKQIKKDMEANQEIKP